MPGKAKIVVSDLHIGAGFAEGSGSKVSGNPLEDFLRDAQWVEFLHQLVDESDEKQLDMELIINGDFLELLQVPAAYPFDASKSYPAELYAASTAADAVTKLKVIFEGHPSIWLGLSDFLNEANPQRSLTMTWGNHDPELYWPEVQDAIRKGVSATGSLANLVRFAAKPIHREGIYVEHGCQYTEPSNRLKNPEDPRDPADPTQIEHPVGSLFVIDFYNDTERQMRWIDNIKPLLAMFWYCMEFDRPLALDMVTRFLGSLPEIFAQARELEENGASAAQDLLRQLDTPAARSQVATQMDSDPAFRQQMYAKISAALDEAEASQAAGEGTTRGLEKVGLVKDAFDSAIYAIRQQRDSLTQAAARTAQQTGAKVILYGHTHYPETVPLPNGATYINTGTWLWTLDFSEADRAKWEHLFKHPDDYIPKWELTYARIDYDIAGQPVARRLAFNRDNKPTAPSTPTTAPTAKPVPSVAPTTDRTGCLGSVLMLPFMLCSTPTLLFLHSVVKCCRARTPAIFGS